MSLDDWLQETLRRLTRRPGRDGTDLIAVTFDLDELDLTLEELEYAALGRVGLPGSAFVPAGALARDEARWHGPGEPVKVGNYTLADGMVYVGGYLPGRLHRNDPGLIDPRLPIQRRNARHRYREIDHWPDYERLSPTDRDGYLAWLAGGRRDTAVPTAFLRLFFFGLERRILGEIVADRTLTAELPALEAEIRALREQFGAVHLFFQYQAARLLEVIEVLSVSPAALMQMPAPAPQTDDDPMSRFPHRLPLVLGAFAAAKQPVPADWAWTWAWQHPEVSPRTPAYRCPDEFRQLFTDRYHAVHGDGLRPRPTKRPLQLYYSPTNAALLPQTVAVPGLTDVFVGKTAGRHLAKLFDDISAELDGYSRWLGRHPNQGGSLPALAMLPASLRDREQPASRALAAWAEAALGEGFTARIDGEMLIHQWDATRPKLPKAAETALLNLLDQLGYGVEPDLRFGGPALQAGKPAILFRPLAGAIGAPTPAYAKATLLLQLAAAVTTADGQLTHQEITHLTRYLDGASTFPPGTRRRLHAHLLWLAAGARTLTGLKAKAMQLTPADRQAMGEVLIGLTAADGAIAPKEVTLLMSAYRLLGLDPDGVTSQLHHALTGPRPRPATKPVTVRPAAAATPGYAIPPRPAADTATASPGGPAVWLDQSVITVKEAETAAVAALLDGIFREEPEDAGPALVAPATGGGAAPDDTLQIRESRPPRDAGLKPRAEQERSPLGTENGNAVFAGLDEVHAGLLRELATATTWSRVDYAALTARHGLLPDAALDVLNEAAFEAADEPVLEGDDLLAINAEALAALRG